MRDFFYVSRTERDYEQVWMTYHRDSFASQEVAFVFSVRACSDAHILLSDKLLGTDNYYEIIFGLSDNTQSTIKDSHLPNYVLESTPGILSCDNRQYYWVRYGTGEVKAGTGRIPGMNIVIRAPESADRNVNAISLTTAEGVVGEWHLTSILRK